MYNASFYVYIETGCGLVGSMAGEADVGRVQIRHVVGAHDCREIFQSSPANINVNLYIYLLIVGGPVHPSATVGALPLQSIHDSTSLSPIHP